ncbi:MAG TPA: polyphenol oxidase family protein [Acidimicrobiia bacterium]|nr:polyphenol oxidase family protein [Acidimicrobiia bacterium]
MIQLRLGPARAVWTDRHGGVSAGAYATANLGTRTGDDPAAVETNRRRLAGTLHLDDPGGWCWLRQVHGSTVLDADAPSDGAGPPADAAVTRTAGRPLTVLTADCAPVALACDDALAVAHAGWTGLLAGVVEAAVARLRAVGHGPVRAALGPCIHPARYEFGADDLARVVDAYGPTVAGTTDDGRPALDLPAGVRAALARVDVTDLEDVDVCTAASPDHFSYRRDGETGRQALVAVLG